MFKNTVYEVMGEGMDEICLPRSKIWEIFNYNFQNKACCCNIKYNI